MQLRGQEKLVNTFMNMKVLPHAFILLGDDGCGKHLFSKDIAEMKELEYQDITETISNDLIAEIQVSRVPTLYTIDIEEVKDQNILLKFLEDYDAYTFVCVLVNNKNLVLNTILNRCIIYQFERYSKEFLMDDIAYTLASDENKPILLNICTTPGQMNDIVNEDLQSLDRLCDTIILKLQDANFSNMLSITSQFNYKDQYGKFNVNTFFKLMLYKLKCSCISNSNYFSYYMLTQKYAIRLNDSRFKREDLLTNYLIELWKLSKGIS